MPLDARQRRSGKQVDPEKRSPLPLFHAARRDTARAWSLCRELILFNQDPSKRALALDRHSLVGLCSGVLYRYLKGEEE